MKQITILLFLTILTQISFAQKTEIRHETAFIGEDENPVSVVEVENSQLKDVEKKWVSYLKKNKGKLSKSGNEHFLDNARIKSISEDTLDIYSTVKAAGKSVIVTMAVNSSGTFISNESGNQTAVDRFLRDFAIGIKKDILTAELKAEKKILGSQGREYDKIEKENKNLEREISSMKNKISDNERKIKNNNDKLKKNKGEIESQKSLINDLERKIKNVE